MRIELPSTPWADTVIRADEDAHTLTVAAPPAAERMVAAWHAEPAPTLRTEVAALEPVVLTLTF